MSVNSGALRSPVVRPQKVQVFSILRPKKGVDRERRRYLVKWRVDGRDRTRSFKTSSEAERFRSSLHGAAGDGETFDEASGLPVRWVNARTGPTWWTWSRDWLLVKWPQWSGHSRRSAIEAASVGTPLLVVKGAPAPPAGLASWLRNDGFLPDTEPKGEMAEWLESVRGDARARGHRRDAAVRGDRRAHRGPAAAGDRLGTREGAWCDHGAGTALHDRGDGGGGEGPQAPARRHGARGAAVTDRITSNPEICFGKPAIRGLRYPVENILELLAGGVGVDEVLADYEDLERDDVLAAVEFGLAKLII